MVAGYKVHGPLLWGLSVGIMDCSIHWMAVESRESLLLLRFLQLMCLFAFCICLFCWKGAQHCCFYIFTTNVHFPGQEENTMFSQQIKLAFCRAVCKSSLFHPTLSMNYFFQRLIYPLQGISGHAQLQGQTVATMFAPIYNNPSDNFRSYGSRKRACKFCRDKKIDFRKGTPMT